MILYSETYATHPMAHYNAKLLGLSSHSIQVKFHFLLSDMLHIDVYSIY